MIGKLRQHRIYQKSDVGNSNNLSFLKYPSIHSTLISTIHHPIQLLIPRASITLSTMLRGCQIDHKRGIVYALLMYLRHYIQFVHVHGTISGGDCSTFVCIMNEILRATILRDY
eukprot:989455_1